MNTPFTASTGGDSKKLEAEKIPTGMRLCTFHSLVDVGTQDGGQYGPKKKVYLGFEFPQEMRVFWEGDGAKPSNIWTMMTLSMHEKAGLRKTFIQPMINKILTDKEAEVFDLSSLLGKQFVATISHSSDGKYANIASITPLTEQTKLMFGIQGVVAQINPTSYFHLGMGFLSENFKAVPKFLRDKLISSAEGLAHSTAGGTFPEPIQTQGGSPSAPTSVRKLIMLPNAQYSEEQYISSGWTQQQIVDNNFAKWEEAVAPPVPLQPQAPPVKASAPVSPVLPPAPVVEKVFKMNDPAAVEADYITVGWTRETLVSGGHASFQ